MDLSKEYIKMCEKAKEIQDIRKGFSSGDLGEIWRKNEQIQVHSGKVYVGIEATWLLRQDQLIDMLQGFMWVVAKGPTMSGAFIAFVDVPPGTIETRCYAPTAEQALLQLVMLENHGKKWDGEKWID